jgi:hypothetical protein
VRIPRPRRGIGGLTPSWSRAAIALGIFAAVQTFVFFARRDRFSVLFWWTSESWLLVTLLWCKNLALAGAAFLAFGSFAHATERIPETAEPESEKSFRHTLLFLAILAAGTALRWVAPRQIPPGVWADALFEAEGVLRDPGNVGWIGGRPLHVESFQNSALVSNLYLKFCGLVFSIFGRGDVGLLALSAVGGTLALPATYWLGRELRGPRFALLAMTLAAFAAWPLVFSRWAWTGSLLLPLVLAGAAAALAALRTGRGLYAVLSGVFVGLSLHTHPAAWAIGAGFATFALTSLSRPGGGRLVAAAAVAGLLAFLPFAPAFLRYPERFGGRAQDVSVFASTKDVAVPGGNGPWAPPLRLLYNGIEYTGIFLWTRDPNPRHGPPDRPPFDPALGLAALIGIAIALRSARAGDAGERLLLLLAGTSLLAGILGNPGGAPNGLRIYPFVGVALLWAAATVDRWVPFAARSTRVRPSLLFGVLLAVLFTAESVPFLAAWPDDRRVVGSFCATETAAGRIRRSLGDAPTVMEPGALGWPIVFEALAAGPDPRNPVTSLPRKTPKELLEVPPRSRFWYIATPDSLERLRKAGWSCSRGVSPAEERHDTVISWVIPARFAAPAIAQE